MKFDWNKILQPKTVVHGPGNGWLWNYLMRPIEKV